MVGTWITWNIKKMSPRLEPIQWFQGVTQFPAPPVLLCLFVLVGKDRRSYHFWHTFFLYQTLYIYYLVEHTLQPHEISIVKWEILAANYRFNSLIVHHPGCPGFLLCKRTVETVAADVVRCLEPKNSKYFSMEKCKCFTLYQSPNFHCCFFVVQQIMLI